MKRFPHLFSGPERGKYVRNLNESNSSTRWSLVLGKLEGGKKEIEENKTCVVIKYYQQQDFHECLLATSWNSRC